MSSGRLRLRNLLNVPRALDKAHIGYESAGAMAVCVGRSRVEVRQRVEGGKDCQGLLRFPKT